MLDVGCHSKAESILKTILSIVTHAEHTCICHHNLMRYYGLGVQYLKSVDLAE